MLGMPALTTAGSGNRENKLCSPPTVSSQSLPLAGFNKKPTGKGTQELEITGVSHQQGCRVGQKGMGGFGKL